MGKNILWANNAFFNIFRSFMAVRSFVCEDVNKEELISSIIESMVCKEEWSFATVFHAETLPKVSLLTYI